MVKEGHCRLPVPFTGVFLSYSVASAGYSYLCYRGPWDQLIRSGAIEPQMAERNPGRRSRTDSHGDRFTAKALPGARLQVCRHTASLSRVQLLPGIPPTEFREVMASKQQADYIDHVWAGLDECQRGWLLRLVEVIASAQRYGDELSSQLLLRLQRAGTPLERIVPALEARVSVYDRDPIGRSSLPQKQAPSLRVVQ